MTKITMISSTAFLFVLLGPSKTLAASLRGNNAKNRELDAQACDEIPKDGDDCTEFLSLTVDKVTCDFVEILETGVGGVVTSQDDIDCECIAPDGKWMCNAKRTAPYINDVPEGVPEVPIPVIVPVNSAPIPSINCPPEESIPNDGESCAGVLGDGASSGRCNYHKRIMKGNETTLSLKSCECTRSDDEKWSCFGNIEESSEGFLEVPIPVADPDDSVPTPPITCPPVESIPKNGESCDGVLADGMSFGICSYYQKTTKGLENTISSKTCNCVRSDEVTAWSCPGEIDDVSEGVTEVITPVPVDPVPTPPITCPPEESIPKNGESCDGVLVDGVMSSRTCSYFQSFMVDNKTFSSGTSCICERSDEETTWSCSQNIDDIPDGATNAKIVELSEWQCRPWENGCSAPHTVLSYCGKTKACCQGSIIDDWMIGEKSCKPAVTFSELVCRPLDIGVGCSAPHTVVADCSGTAACCPGSILDDWRTGEKSCKPILHFVL